VGLLVNGTILVASGPAVVPALEAAAQEVARGDLGLVRSGDHVVVWDARSRWVTAEDDGDVLVLLDGRVHAGLAADGSSVGALRRRYRLLHAELARGLLGDFVVVVLDRTRGRLLVARDPVGVRPWYQAQDGNSFGGATAVGDLLAMPWVDGEPDPATAVQYLAGVESRAGTTWHRGITTLRPGRTWQREGGTTRTIRHHNWRVQRCLGLKPEEANERARELLDLAVLCRVRSAGAATAQLSGGFDSSAVVGTAALLGSGDVLAGRLVFEGPAADERRFSDAVAERWGVELISEAPWLPTVEESVALVRRLGRPLPDPNFTMFAPLYRAFSVRGRHDGLSGLGGDDVFVASSREARLISAIQARRPALLAPLLRAAGRSPRAAWRDDVRPALKLWAPRTPQSAPMWVAQAASRDAGLDEILNRRVPTVTGVLAVDERIEALDDGYQATILEDVAVVGDLSDHRTSHPYFDPRLMEGLLGLDPELAVAGGHDRAVQVTAFRDRLPDLVARRRTKAEFSEVVWPNGLDEQRWAAVSAGPLVDRGWLDRPGWERLVAVARGRRPGAASPLSRVLGLDLWLRARG
jgi:asparagine synthase (glutamine-hydrolysing)